MATEVKIPSMGESISSGILAAWHVSDGDYVEKDQTLYELETDKITSEANAEASGTISLKAAEGDEVEIGQVVAFIDESAAAPDSGSAPEKSTDAGGGDEAKGGETAPAAEESSAEPAETNSSDSAPEEPSDSGGEEAAPAEKSVAAGTLSPAARKAAEENNVDVSRIEGSGKGGRVTKSDILEAAKSAPAKSAEPEPKSQPEPSEQPSPAPASASKAEGERETRRKLSPLRRKIAERLVSASRDAALLTTFNEVDMSEVMRLRKTHQDQFVEKHGLKLGFMSFFTKAVTHALKEIPAVNARIEGDTVVEQHYYDIGIAVGTDKGLMVPVVRECDSKSFAEIEQAILDYAKAARDGKIQLSDLEGGVFTISNGGIYGSMLSTPIVNHPQPAILGLHNIEQRAVVRDGDIVARPMMYLALTYDHRLIDGKEAVTFLNTVKHAIEDPTRLLFGV